MTSTRICRTCATCGACRRTRSSSYARDLARAGRVRREARAARRKPSSAATSRRSRASLMASGLAPRSVARAIACVRGYYQFLLVEKPIEADPGRRSARAARVAGAAEVSSTSKRSIGCWRSPTPSTPRGTARQGADRAALRDRPARHRAAVAQGRRPHPRRRLPDLHRQGGQAAHRPARPGRRRLGAAVHGGGAGRRC